MNGHFSYKGKTLCQVLNTGKASLHGRSQCPAKEAISRKCGKRGHYKCMCKSKPGASVRTVYVDDTDSDAFLGTVTLRCSSPVDWLLSQTLMEVSGFV